MAITLNKVCTKVAGKLGYTLRPQRSKDSYAGMLSALGPVETEHPLIRVGGDNDGGYLVPDDLDGIEACFSPGVSEIATFEEAMIARGMRVYQIDASVQDTPLKDPRNEFERKFLGIVTREPYITLDDWVAEKRPVPNGDLILQIDIEGHEWLTLAQVSTATLRRFRIIVLELHFLDLVTEPFVAEMFTPVLDRLAEHFDCVHLHANNCGGYSDVGGMRFPSVVEVTLLRKDRSTKRVPVRSLPHPLDQENVTSLPVLKIPKEMYRNG